MKKNILIVSLVLIVCSSFILIKSERPTLYTIGDSTVRNSNKETWGWGTFIGDFFDSTRLQTNNQAMAGRSTRTFVKEKRWEKVTDMLQAGDFVIMQFGHNDGSKPDTSKAGYRGSLRGIGEDTVLLTWPDGTKETVHTYGWYLRKFIRETKAKGATPIVASLIPRNIFKDGKVERGDKDYAKWAAEVAKEEGAYFVNLNAISADKYDVLGPDEVKKFFPGDHTHTNAMGAKLNAASVVDGIKLLPECGLNQYLLK